MDSFAKLNQKVALLTPPPFIQPENYDGFELKYKFLVFRPAQFQTEAYLLGIVIVYGLLAYLGASSNVAKGQKWLKAHMPILESQFSRPTVDGLTQDGYTDFFNFSTGRRNITSLHSVFRLTPRHDLLQNIYHKLYSLVDLNYKKVDELQLDFLLAPGALPHDFVWGIVDKDELRTVKTDRWDLTFTKTSENPALPSTLSVMAEYADITESIFKNTNLLNFVKDEKNLRFFRSLSITDQPRDRPQTLVPANERQKHVILNLIAPPASQAAETAELVAALFTFIDALSKIPLRPETKTKLRKTREELDRAVKEESEREHKEELEQAKEDEKAKKRQLESERISKLSASEQAKILEKEKKRQMRRSQGKAARK